MVWLGFLQLLQAQEEFETCTVKRDGAEDKLCTESLYSGADGAEIGNEKVSGVVASESGEGGSGDRSGARPSPSRDIACSNSIY